MHQQHLSVGSRYSSPSALNMSSSVIAGTGCVVPPANLTIPRLLRLQLIFSLAYRLEQEKKKEREGGG